MTDDSDDDFRFGSGSIMPPARFSDGNGMSAANNSFEMQAASAVAASQQPPQEVRTLGRKLPRGTARMVHHQIQV